MLNGLLAYKSIKPSIKSQIKSLSERYELCVIYILLQFCTLGGNFHRFVYLHALPVFYKLRDTSEKTSHHGKRSGGVIVLVRNVY